MYISKYYTCPQIDQRLLQGYYDDAIRHGFIGNMNDFWKFILSIRECIKLTPDSVATQNNFSNELKAKLDSIEYGARRVTQMSQLDNNTHYQNELEVRNIINPLINEVNTRITDIHTKQAAINNQVSNISNTVSKLEKDITTLTTLINDINTKTLPEISGKLKKLEDSIKELSKKVDNNETKINAIQPIKNSEVISKLTKLD